MQKTTGHDLNNDNAVYLIAEENANLVNLKCLGVLAVLSEVSIILNFIGVFSVQRDVMLVSLTTVIVLFLVPIFLYLIYGKAHKNRQTVLQKSWFHVLIIVNVFLGIGIICTALSFHATILMVIPPLMAAQYRYSKRLFRNVTIASLMLVPISIYGSFFFGTPDRNFIKGMLTDEEAKIFSNRIAIATPDRMLSLFTHYTLPLLLGIIVVAVLIRWIIVRNSTMLDRQMVLIKQLRKETEHRNEMQNHVIEVLANMIEARDVNTGEHVFRTKKLAGMLARAMQKEEKYSAVMTDDEIERIERAAPLHDVGKIVVSDTILLKPGKLTTEEFEKMKKHTTASKELIENLLFDTNDEKLWKTAEDIASYHHERWDGAGYPEGLRGEEIPLSARIMAVADVYDALVSKRVYKEPVPPEKALEIMFSESGTHFDPDIMLVLEKIQDQFIDFVKTQDGKTPVSE